MNYNHGFSGKNLRGKYQMRNLGATNVGWIQPAKWRTTGNKVMKPGASREARNSLHR